jgi:hypothetical protein
MVNYLRCVEAIRFLHDHGEKHGDIPDSLNRIFLHFSRGANWFYEHTSQLIQDLQQAMADIR